jgi:hypothetical protein
MKKRTKMKVPISSEIVVLNIESSVGFGLIVEFDPTLKNFIANAAKAPPIYYPPIYIRPLILLCPKFEFFLSMHAIVTAGLKCAPEIFIAKRVIIQYPKSIPAKLPPSKL